MSRAAADFVTDYVNNKPEALLCIPSGESATGMLKYLADYASEGRVDFNKCFFVGLDEWVGMNEEDEGSCTNYMYSNVFNPLKIKPERIIFFNAIEEDLDAECERVDSFIKDHGGLDIMMVGIGMNGHIGLNEPGVDFDLYSHRSQLDTVTKTVGQKYFKQETELREGITLGPKHFLEAKVAVLIASGLKKAAIISKALEGEITNQLPASIIQMHHHAFVFLDREAASQLSTINKKG
jgi:glucosamine-6-phosphate isomerase